MKAILVCVDYGDILALTLPRNAKHFERMVIVTTPGDLETQEVVRQIPNAECHLTNVFYEGDVIFNKGAGMEEGFDKLGRDGWIVVMDADIVLPLPLSLPQQRDSQKLYGAGRYMLADPSQLTDELDWAQLPAKHDKDAVCGYFQLFHADAAVLQSRPWYPVYWKHCGGPDSDFEKKWDKRQRIRMPGIYVLHLGPDGTNWCGRVTPKLDGTPEPDAVHRLSQLRTIYTNRRRLPGQFPNERLPR